MKATVGSVRVIAGQQPFCPGSVVRTEYFLDAVELYHMTDLLRLLRRHPFGRALVRVERTTDMGLSDQVVVSWSKAGRPFALLPLACSWR